MLWCACGEQRPRFGRSGVVWAPPDYVCDAWNGLVRALSETMTAIGTGGRRKKPSFSQIDNSSGRLPGCTHRKPRMPAVGSSLATIAIRGSS